MRKILIIEDDLIDQMAFTRMLDQQDFELKYSIANSIKEAKKCLIEKKFDLVISDLNLADGTTFDLLDFFKNIPFILISGNEDEHTINSLIHNSGASAFFTKDINLNYLKKLESKIYEIFDPTNSSIHSEKETFNSERRPKILQNEHVIVNLENAYKVFDEKKEDIKETIELFILHKPKEMDQLYNAIYNRDGENVKKITHRMKSGFRFLGMKKQVELAEFIHNNNKKPQGEPTCEQILEAFKQLSLDTKIAIELLKKEIPFL